MDGRSFSFEVESRQADRATGADGGPLGRFLLARRLKWLKPGKPRPRLWTESAMSGGRRSSPEDSRPDDRR